MRNFERGHRYESLATDIARIAYAYGFSAAPVALSQRSVADTGSGDAKTAVAIALMNSAKTPAPPAQSWGMARKGAGTVVTFAVTGARQTIAHAIVVKTALSVAEMSGYTDLSVSVSSIGDAESRKRFTRELGNFFRKNHEALAPEVRSLAAGNPDAAYRALLEKNDPLAAKAPHSIDYLSEPSRKNMLSILSLFESVGIPYVLDPKLTAEPGVQSEILFAIDGADRRGNKVHIASGGRFDEYLKRERGKSEPAIAISVEMPEKIDLEARDEDPTCFVIHVGDAAKLRAFSVLEALWRAHVAVGQALMAENLRDQMVRGAGSKAKYLAIIGQREALDNTVIVRTVATQMQTTLPLEKLGSYVSRPGRPARPGAGARR
jgi:histidyl-tRNA synthetase